MARTVDVRRTCIFATTMSPRA